MTLRARRRILNITAQMSFAAFAMDDEDDAQQLSMFAIIFADQCHQLRTYVPTRTIRPFVTAKSIQDFNDDECYLYFRFKSQDQLRRVFAVLAIPDAVTIMDGTRTHKFSGQEIFLFSLYRMAVAPRMVDAVMLFGRDNTQWSRAWTWFIENMYRNWRHLLNKNLDYFVPSFGQYNSKIVETCARKAQEWGYDDIFFDFFRFIYPRKL